MHNYRRYLLGVQYKGTKYGGWISDIGAPIPSIATKLHFALKSFAGEENYNCLRGSSRTDAGVHAIRNTFQIDICRKSRKLVNSFYEPDVVMKAINRSLCREDIIITDCRMVPDTFDARICATGRTYMYRILASHTSRPSHWVLQNDTAWTTPQLNVRDMRQAAAHLIGMHDFSTFRNTGCQARSPWKHLTVIDIDERKNSYQNDIFAVNDVNILGGNDLITIKVTGSSFLYRMVRNMVGMLVDIGRGLVHPSAAAELLRKRDRKLLRTSVAPACGLYLANVHYNDEDLRMPTSNKQ